MKRTELKRSGPPKRKKGIRRVSRKRAMLSALVNPGRKGFLLLHSVCMVCEDKPSEDVHEIARGAAREECLRHPELWLAVCRTCHDGELSDVVKWPPQKQLALRMYIDALASVNALNRLRGRAPSAITVGEVLELIRRGLT